jgi:hypothetical protein
MGIIWDKKTMYYISLIGELGVIFIINILAFVYIYKTVYRRYFIENGLIFIVFLIAGIISGGMTVYKMILKK